MPHFLIPEGEHKKKSEQFYWMIVGNIFLPVLDSFAFPECELSFLSSSFSHELASGSDLVTLHSYTEVIEVLMKEQNLIFQNVRYG